MLGSKEFLNILAGSTRASATGAASKPPRFAVIDPDYSSGLPQVTFDGETELTAKGYPYLAHYSPTASDRVFLLAGGSGYVIIGSVVA